MLREQYNALIKEHFDIMNNETRKVLVTINEADQNQVLGSLATRLYDSIVKKATDIDYGQIPASKGDITKIPNYLDIVQALTTVRDMQVATKQSTESADIIFTAIENLKKSNKLWDRGFLMDCEMIVVFYNTIALSIVSATSLLISATVEFVKEPDSGIIDLELAKVSNHKTRDGLLFKNLEKFNKAYKKGDIEKTLEPLLRAQRQMKESVENNGTVVMENIAALLFTGAMVVGLLSTIIPILHQLTTSLYCLRQNLSEYLSGEADIIMLNAEKVQYNRTKTPEQKKKIIAKQHKIADRFKKWANKLIIKSTKAEKDAEKMIKEEQNNKKKIGDIVDDMPDSASIF